MDTLDLEARLGEYLQQLALLKQEDIRIPNQSLILDFFCIDEQFSKFLRQDIFRPVDDRHKTWNLINLREAESKETIGYEELGALLAYKGHSSEKIWRKIVYCTAQHQNNIKSLELIDRIITSDAVELVLNNHRDRESALANSDAIPSPSRSDSNEAISTKIPKKSEERTPQDNNPASREPNYLGIAFGSISAVVFLSLFLSAVLVTGLSNSTTEVGVQEPSSSSDDTDGLATLENDSKDAVLICELRPLIERANSLSLSQKSLIDRRDKIVSDANKAIAFLDQSGAKSKYWEDPSCRWGEQWYDQHTNNNFRAFVAVSKKCVNPKLNYEYSSDKDGKNILEKGTLSLSGHRSGEVSIPYMIDSFHYLFIRNVTCS